MNRNPPSFTSVAASRSRVEVACAPNFNRELPQLVYRREPEQELIASMPSAAGPELFQLKAASMTELKHRVARRYLERPAADPVDQVSLTLFL